MKHAKTKKLQKQLLHKIDQMSVKCGTSSSLILLFSIRGEMATLPSLCIYTQNSSQNVNLNSGFWKFVQSAQQPQTSRPAPVTTRKFWPELPLRTNPQRNRISPSTELGGTARKHVQTECWSRARHHVDAARPRWTNCAATQDGVFILIEWQE